MEKLREELARLEAGLDAREALSPENINSTALDIIQRAFCAIRGCAHNDPVRAGKIADAFHNLPLILQRGSHQARREETIRALHDLIAIKSRE